MNDSGRGQGASSGLANRPLLYLSAFATVFFWGASFPLTKAALDQVGPTALAFLRWVISAAALLGWLAARGRLPLAAQLVRREAPALLWIALTGVTLFYWLENAALRFTTATNAGVLSNLTSVFIVVVSALWLRERFGVRGWLAMAVAFVGAALVSQGAGHVSFAGEGLRGDLLMVTATLFAALYSVGGKRLVASYRPDVATALMAALGAALLLPLALLEGLTLRLPAITWGAIVVLGLGSGALANLFWLHLLSRVEASHASLYLFLIPVISTALSVVGLGEPLTLTMIVGALLVLAGMAVAQRPDGQERREGVKP